MYISAEASHEDGCTEMGEQAGARIPEATNGVLAGWRSWRTQGELATDVLRSLL
jgi:hypothetical protein